MLSCEVASIKAVTRVESGPLGGFLDDDTPVILFERHLFHRLTGGKYDAVKLSTTKPEHSFLSMVTPGGYGPSSLQHAKLAAAALLDRDAALKSCSWGLFQILGLNFERAGFQRLQRFINAMYRSVDDHLRAFVNFVQSDESLADAIRTKNWPSFARQYNGPAYAKNKYDEKLAEAYLKEQP